MCNQAELEKVRKLLNKQDQLCVMLQKRDLTLAAADTIIGKARGILAANDAGWTPTHMGENCTRNHCGEESHKFEVAVKKLQRNEPLDEADKPHVKMMTAVMRTGKAKPKNVQRIRMRKRKSCHHARGNGRR